MLGIQLKNDEIVSYIYFNVSEVFVALEK